MSITLSTSTALRALLSDKAEVQVEGTTIGELLDALHIRDRICDSEGKVRRHFNIHINEGDEIRLLDGLDTPVKDGESVMILSAIAGGAEVARKVWLTFPKELIGRPLIWEVGQTFRVITNIRQASVHRELGIVGIEISGDGQEVQKAIDFLSEAGVSVEPIEMEVVA